MSDTNKNTNPAKGFSSYPDPFTPDDNEFLSAIMKDFGGVADRFNAKAEAIMPELFMHPELSVEDWFDKIRKKYQAEKAGPAGGVDKEGGAAKKNTKPKRAVGGEAKVSKKRGRASKAAASEVKTPRTRGRASKVAAIVDSLEREVGTGEEGIEDESVEDAEL